VCEGVAIVAAKSVPRANPDVALGVLRDAGHKVLRLSVALRESVYRIWRNGVQACREDSENHWNDEK
jgi:hypothetical protein